MILKLRFIDILCFVGGIAQLGERLHGMQEVSGSNPLTSTNQKALNFFKAYIFTAFADAHAQCRLKPPSSPVTSKTSPIKNKCGHSLLSMV